MACGCNKAKVAQPIAPQQAAQNNMAGVTSPKGSIDFSSHPEFVKVVYNGPSYTHLVGSPTGIIANFGIRDYGMGKGGSIIFVHKADLEKSSWLYTVANESALQILAEASPIPNEVFENTEKLIDSSEVVETVSKVKPNKVKVEKV